MRSRFAVGRLVAVLLLLVALVAGCSATATDTGGGVDADSGLPVIAESRLPTEAKDTLELIDKGGPFPYDKDGATFGNREGLLPDESRGFYHEYTVPTPGEGDRGARRIVTGDHDTIFYYTDDHYDSFSRIRR